MPDEPQNSSNDVPDPSLPTSIRVTDASETPDIQQTDSDSAPLPPVPVTDTEPATSPVSPLASSEPRNQPEPDATEGGHGAQPPKKSKKLLVAGIIAGVLVLLGGSGVLAYNLWYQNPDKVVTDGLSNLFVPATNKSTTKLSFSSENTDAVLTVDTATATNRAKGTAKLDLSLKDADDTKKMQLSADFVTETDGAKVFIRLNDIQRVVDEAIDSIIEQQTKAYSQLGQEITPQQIAQGKQQLKAQLQPIVDKIDGKWISFVSKQNQEAEGGISEQQKCISDVMKKLGEGGNMRDELVDTYAQHRFIIIKEELGTKDGSLGYVLDLDMKKVQSFSEAGEKAAVIKALKECTSDNAAPTEEEKSEPLTKEDNPLKDVRLELWVDQWTHRITGLKVTSTKTDDTSDGTFALDVVTDYVKVSDDEVKLPEGAVDGTKLVGELFMSSMMMGVPAGPQTVEFQMSTRES